MKLELGRGWVLTLTLAGAHDGPADCDCYTLTRLVPRAQHYVQQDRTFGLQGQRFLRILSGAEAGGVA